MNQSNILQNAICGTELDTGMPKFQGREQVSLVREAVNEWLSLDEYPDKVLWVIAEAIDVGIDKIDTNPPRFAKLGLNVIDRYANLQTKAGYVARALAMYIELNENFDLIEWLDGDEDDDYIEDDIMPNSDGGSASGEGDSHRSRLPMLYRAQDFYKFLDRGIMHFEILAKNMQEVVPALNVSVPTTFNRDPEGDEVDNFVANMDQALDTDDGIEAFLQETYELERKVKAEAIYTPDLADAETHKYFCILCLDGSASMTTDNRLIRAAVILYARLLDVKDGRGAIAMVVYDDEPQLWLLDNQDPDSWLIDTPEKADKAIDVLLERYQGSYGSWTNTAKAINFCANIVRKVSTEYVTPSIMLITDEAGLYGAEIDDLNGITLDAVVAEENEEIKNVARSTSGVYMKVERIPVSLF